MTETIGDETQRGCFAISYCGGLFHADCFMISFIFYVYVLFMYVLTYLLQLYDVCDNENSHMQLHAGFHFSSTHSRYIEYRISIEGQTHSRCFESWVHRSEVRIYASLVRIISLLYVVHSWLCTVITTLENIENIEPGRRSTLELSIDLPSPLETELYTFFLRDFLRTSTRDQKIVLSRNRSAPPALAQPWRKSARTRPHMVGLPRRLRQSLPHIKGYRLGAFFFKNNNQQLRHCGFVWYY